VARAAVELSDGWQLRGCLGREWEWHVGLDKPWDAPGWLPARVPGSVIDDLWRAGQVPNPYYERNSLQLEWVWQRSWVYRCRFVADGEPATLAFDGVDHSAGVFVDGEQVAEHEGAYRPFDVAVPAGEHLLAVVVHPAPASEPQVGDTSRVAVHKSRMGYGWDFCPRMVHQGIWRPVTLYVGDGPPKTFPRIRLEDGVGVVELGDEEVRIETPELWWPNELGEQHLYRVGEFSIGFREIEFTPPGTFVVNGVEMPVRGWNWVPIDALYGVPRPAKLEHLLGLAARAHVNLLRVWGGGLIETEEFYDLCDRLGLLVWQEFSMSSSIMGSVPSADPAFVQLMVEDARDIVPRKRHHPSLALWCGGNELVSEGPLFDALREVVRELDPERAWLPTSPSGDDEVHGPWEHQGLASHNVHYDGGTWSLHSEFGVEGMTNRRTHEALMPLERRWPVDRSNPVYEHLGAWWNNAPLVQEAFGGRITDVETMRRASQHLQYDGLRYAVEANRRRGAGTIPWQFNESYPNAWCTAAVDHRGDPKPAYYGVARAYRPDHPSASFARWCWGGERKVRARVWSAARFVDVNGTVVAQTDGDEIAAPLDAFTSDVFVLDLGNNRYVMTRTDNLAPLLDLAPATIEAHRVGDELHLRHVDGPAALGVLIAGETEEWTVLSDNMIDLLPGEERTIEVQGADELRIDGWNVRVA
jgi:beta-mannosidase